jgi:hypothetical protein
MTVILAKMLIKIDKRPFTWVKIPFPGFNLFVSSIFFIQKGICTRGAGE